MVDQIDGSSYSCCAEPVVVMFVTPFNKGGGFVHCFLESCNDKGLLFVDAEATMLPHECLVQLLCEQLTVGFLVISAWA